MKKKHYVLLLAIVALLAVAAGCKNDRDDTDTAADTSPPDRNANPDDELAAHSTDAAFDTSQPGDTTPLPPGNAAGAPAESAALGILNAINEHEIAAGRQALDKKVEGKVAEYAQMMIDEHTANKKATSSFAVNASDVEASEQMRKGEAHLQDLAKKEGSDYSRAYIQAMVSGHTDALSMIDQKLIPAATTPEVQAHLRQTRERVEKHLELAQALQEDR
jgi:putative membrane protein